MPVYSTFYANTLRLFSSSKAALVFRGHFDVKTDSPKRVVTIVHVMTISGHFLANPFNIFHTIEALLVILNNKEPQFCERYQRGWPKNDKKWL